MYLKKYVFHGILYLQYKKNVFITCELCGKESRGEKFHAKHLYTTHGLEQKVSECTLHVTIKKFNL